VTVWLIAFNIAVELTATVKVPLGTVVVPTTVAFQVQVPVGASFGMTNVPHPNVP